jgi:hypothetical protein
MTALTPLPPSSSYPPGSVELTVERTTGVGAWLDILEPAVALARQIALTDFVPKALREKNGREFTPEQATAAVTACILFGAEIGIGPMQSLSKIHIVEGRPAPSAELARSLLLSAGHDMWVEEATTTRVTVAGKRANSDHVQKVTWTMDDAKKAGLAGKQNWAKYPRQMLAARATAELARLVAPDALGGISVFAEEIGDDEPADLAAEQAGAPAQAKPKTRRLAAAPPPVAPAEEPPLPGEGETPQEAPQTALSAVPDAPPEPPLPGEEEAPAPVGKAVSEVVVTAQEVVNVPLPPLPEEPLDLAPLEAVAEHEGARPSAPAGKITNPQIRKLMAVYGTLGIKDRGDQKRISAELLALDALGSHTELSTGQASMLIDMLEVLDPFQDIVWQGEEPNRRPYIAGGEPEGEAS